MGRWAGVGGLLLVAVFWGGMIPLTKYQLDRWDPYFLVAIRSLGAAPLLWLLMQWTDRNLPKPTPVATWRVWTFGIVGNGGFAVLYTVGVQFSDPVLAAILTATGPAVAAVTDRVFFRLPFNRLMVPGLIASPASAFARRRHSSAYIAEGSAENIFIIQDGEITTPDLNSCLDGITRRTVIQLAKDHGYTVQEKRITRDALYVCDEAFFTGTAAEVTPIRECDNKAVGSGKRGPITEKLQKAYLSLVKGESDHYPQWLTLV